MDGIAILGHFHFLAGFPSLCRGIRSEFRVSHAPAFSAEPSRVLHHWIGLWVRRFFGARVGHLASGDDCRSHGRQTGRGAGHAVDRCCVYAAQRNAGTAHWFLAGALAGPPPHAGTFLRLVYSLHGFVEFYFAPNAALRRPGAAGLSALAAILCVVSALACRPRLG